MALAADVVISMGCGDDCPPTPGARRNDWDLPDPAGQDLKFTRRVRDDIAGVALIRLMTPHEQPVAASGPVHTEATS